METRSITSLTNPRVKQAIKLRNRKGREETGLFLIEGIKELKLALDAGIRPAEAFMNADAGSPALEELVKECARQDGTVYACSKQVMAKISYGDRDGDILACAPLPAAGLDTLALPDDPLVVVLEALEKPGNLGAVLRTADGAGVNAVIICERGCDIYNPNVIRASRGAVFTVPSAAAGSDEVLAWLKDQNITCAAVTPEADQIHTDADLTGPLALVFGTEHDGLSGTWREAADRKVSIPMQGQADSLNVSTAAAILFYEAVRQRG